jgi:hypothetical protein
VLKEFEDSRLKFLVDISHKKHVHIVPCVPSGHHDRLKPEQFKELRRHRMIWRRQPAAAFLDGQ